MPALKINHIYRHFKGIYVLVKDLAYHSETEEKYVVYQHLDDGKVWIRKLDDFLSPIDNNRSDNITGQKYRFELFKFKNEEAIKC